MYKSQLQEYAQRAAILPPVYSFVKDGASHEPRFKASVTFNNVVYESPPGFPNLKSAEHAAAKVTLDALNQTTLGVGFTPTPVIESGLCKNLLQEYSQKNSLHLPVYHSQRTGEDHAPTFYSSVEIAGVHYSGGVAKSKKEAEIKAAKTALLAIQSAHAASTNGAIAHPQALASTLINFQNISPNIRKRGRTAHVTVEEPAVSKVKLDQGKLAQEELVKISVIIPVGAQGNGTVNADLPIIAPQAMLMDPEPLIAMQEQVMPVVPSAGRPSDDSQNTQELPAETDGKLEGHLGRPSSDDSQITQELPAETDGKLEGKECRSEELGAATQPEAVLAKISEVVANEPEQVVANEPELVVATEPELAEAMEPELVVAQELDHVVAKEPELMVAQELDSVAAKKPEAVVAIEPELVAEKRPGEENQRFVVLLNGVPSVKAEEQKATSETQTTQLISLAG